MIIVKKHKSNGKKILAICDKELIGKTLEDGEIFLEVKESFYGGKPMNKNEIKKLCSEVNIINFLGNESYSVIKEIGFDDVAILMIENVPHGQISIIKNE